MFSWLMFSLRSSSQNQLLITMLNCLYVKIRILNGRHTGNLVSCNFLLMVGSGKSQSSGSVSLRHKTRNNQTSESQRVSWVKLLPLNQWTTNWQRWKCTNPLKQEAGKDDCPEMNSRCVERMMGVNWETAPLSLEIEKLGKDWQETEVRRKGGGGHGREVRTF